MQSIAFVDAMQQYQSGAVVLPPSSKSPVFDFDDVWADHVLALRNTAKASLGDAGWPVLLPMEGVSPTAMHHLGVKPEEYSQTAATAAATHWPTFSTGAPVALNPQLGGDGDGWTTTNSASSTYGAMFPTTTFGGYMMPIDQTSSTTSVSTLESPRSSRGSKRPPSTDDDEDEDSPLEFASSKAKRPRFDVNPSFSFSSASFSKCGSGSNGVQTTRYSFSTRAAPPSLVRLLLLHLTCRWTALTSRDSGKPCRVHGSSQTSHHHHQVIIPMLSSPFVLCLLYKSRSLGYRSRSGVRQLRLGPPRLSENFRGPAPRLPNVCRTPTSARFLSFSFLSCASVCMTTSSTLPHHLDPPLNLLYLITLQTITAKPPF
ncbi:hypothetical protein M407DRAFT_241883 [Tulasnella calospora MUT 4182]|uniref:Uncharacterized protein n=1 Tax=Tulasnella calospora MUT 4182 TaxID=1051891 RepID=A0A0C3QH84_9AGAM|nr:hypothetical protein M407DRAFT_241883 [Tulasnella calospora MUT 4182]